MATGSHIGFDQDNIRPHEVLLLFSFILVVSRVGCLGCYGFLILLIIRDTRVNRDKTTTVYKYIRWRFIYSKYFTISELVDRSRPRPNTKDVTRCVLPHTPCPPYGLLSKSLARSVA